MAFLAPVVRWPDIIGIKAADTVAAVQPHLPSPLASMSPELLQSLLISFALIAIVTVGTTVLQLRSRHAIKESPAGATGRRRRRRAAEAPLVLLTGPSGVGKTSLYSALAFKAVPSIHPSQRQSDSIVTLGPGALSVRVVDTPGHARIKDDIIREYIGGTDAIVVCIDAKEALRGNAALTKDSPLVEAIDHLHSVLIHLAKARRTEKNISDPPILIVLFTRADLSPHLATISDAPTSPDEGKRRAILTTRAKNAVEMELGRRRAGMGFGARRTTKVGGMGKVVGGEQTRSIWATIRGVLGMDKGASRTHRADDDDDEGDDDGVAIDYVDWDTLERLAAKSNSAEKSTSFSAGTSLDRLDPDIVYNGRAVCAFASVGKERGWKERDIEGVHELQQILKDL